jgi:hypothetical protein
MPAKCYAPVLRTADCPAKLAGPGAVRSTQLGKGDMVFLLNPYCALSVTSSYGATHG